MKVYTDTVFSIFMLFITLFLISPFALLMIPVGVGLSGKWLSVDWMLLIIVVFEPLMLWVLYIIFAQWIIAIKERKYYIFEFDEYIFSYRYQGSLSYQSIKVADIESVKFSQMSRAAFVNIYAKNQAVVAIHLDWLNVNNKELMTTFQRVMKLEKAYGWDGTDLRKVNKSNVM